MARKTAPTFIPNAGHGSIGLLALDDIPEEVKKEAEEIYAALKTADGRIRVEFDTKEEVRLYALQLNSYCEQRPAGKIRFRRSPSKGLKYTQMDFKITDVPEEKPETPANSETPPAEPNAGEKRKPGRPRKVAA